MRWAYDDDTRDLFGKGIHRDILIVPHATFVNKVPGGPPEIISKIPKFHWVPAPVWDPDEQKFIIKQKPVPMKDENDEWIRDDVEWIITNDDIVKEKFKYSSSLNSDDNLTFSSCNAAMIQFTIRNKKEYVEELDDEGEPTGNYYWEQEVPNLYKYEKTVKDPNGTTRKVVGELMSNSCIKAYMYFNGDSSTLMYLGMFKVEEDKLIDNGYNRQITAYDFLAWFREIDIFYWYQHLFTGINKLGNDYEDYTNDTDSKEQHTEKEWEDNYIRQPKEKWTIKEALEDLMGHFAAYDMTVWEKEVVDEETGKKEKVMKLGTTTSNPNEYGRDDYEEDNGYTGLGMPILLDPDIMTKGNKPYMPTEPGPDEIEKYGYMNILELEFYQDPKIMKSESLSAGKFLEDIGLLAGRYPYIRTDKIDDEDYVDPKTIQPTESEPHPSRYICYEKCYLTFKPLPSAEKDKNVDKVPESMFDNHDIVKGFQHDYYQVQDITVMKFELDDGTEIKYSKLTKDQLVAEQKSELQTFTITNNMFANYLVTKSDDDDVKKMLDKYKVIREKLFGKNSTAGNMSPDALFQQGYNNIRNRIYTPYQLTTFADPVRDVGDRIKIDFTDMITGEQSHFYTYILERELNGIQAMMDTYTAKGTMKNPMFTNYQTSSKAKSGGDASKTSEDLDIMTPFDLIEYMRNCGYRMLDEPSDCQANFAKGSEQDDGGETHIFHNLSGNPYYAPEEYYPKDGDTTNPYKLCTDWGADYAYYEDVTANIGDYVQNLNYDSSDNPDPAVLDTTGSPLYVWTANSKWEFVGSGSYDYGGNGEGCNLFDTSGVDVKLDEGDGSFVEGSTCNTLILSPTPGSNSFYKGHMNSLYYTYGSYLYTDETISETITVNPIIGDAVRLYGANAATWYYQYPGVWVKNIYPQLDVPITIKTKPYVLLKWSDPEDITDWQPTPAEWEGTVIVRKEDSAPLHRWDGEKVVLNKTRDKYKTKGYKDENIKMGRIYYYGFFPYYTADDSDPEHPIRYYTFTKVIKVETGDNSIASTIDSIEVNGNTATIKYTLEQPDSATFASVKIYGKNGSNPSCDNTDDVVVDADPEAITKDITGLDYSSTYYFCLVTVDSNDEELNSNIESCTTVDRVTPREYRDTVTILTHMYAPGMDDTEFYDVPAAGMSWNDSTKATCSYYHNSQTLSSFYGWSSGLCYSSSALDININFVSASSTNYKVTIANCSNVKAWIDTWSYSADKSRSVCERVDIVDVDGGKRARCNPVSNSWTGAGNYVSDYNNKTLTEIFTKLVNQFRNCNVYVNGVQWGQQGVGYL